MNLFFKLIFYSIKFLLFAILFSSCDESKLSKSSETDSYSLKMSSKTLTFEIDSNTINHTKFLSVYTDTQGKGFLAYANVTNKVNEILIFDIDSQKQIKSLSIDVEGPNGIGFINGFYIKDWNNIYVTSQSALFIALFDSSGIMKNKINYAKTNTNENVFPSIVDYHNHILFDDFKILLPMLPDGNWTYMSQDDLNQKYICLQIDTINREVKYLPFTLPKDYWSEGKKDPVFSRVKGEGGFIYSFLGDENIYVTQNHYKYNKYSAGSAFFEKTNPYPKNKSGVNDYMKYMIENSYYEYLLYDPYRQVYYRFVQLGEPLDNENDMEKVAKAPPSFSIIIIGKNFQKMGETKFPRNKFLYANAFVTKEGLYLSNNHPQNAEMQDDKLSFTLLELVKN